MANETAPGDPTPAPGTSGSADPPAGVLRLRRPNREQVAPVPVYLDALVGDEHLARLLWQAVAPLDLSGFTAGLVVVEGGPGRAATDPHLLVSLWLYATSQGGQQRAGTGAAVRRAPGLPLAVRRCPGQLPHPERFPDPAWDSLGRTDDANPGPVGARGAD